VSVVYTKKGKFKKFKGHVLNFMWDVETFVEKLPWDLSDLPIILTRLEGYEDVNIHVENIIFPWNERK
jgi:hypothetical protein